MASRRFTLALFVVVALAAMAVAAYGSEFTAADAMIMTEPDGHGLLADAMQFDEEMMMENESARRQLRGRHRGYISYGAMYENNVPCDLRGQSYYNCAAHQRANPYSRGCTRVTMCARNTR